MVRPHVHGYHRRPVLITVSKHKVQQRCEDLKKNNNNKKREINVF